MIEKILQVINKHNDKLKENHFQSLLAEYNHALPFNGFSKKENIKSIFNDPLIRLFPINCSLFQCLTYLNLDV